MQDMRNESCQLRGAMCKYARGEKYALIAFFYFMAYFCHCVMVINKVIVVGITILSWPWIM